MYVVLFYMVILFQCNPTPSKQSNFKFYFNFVELRVTYKKYINNKERERHLPGYCQKTLLKFVDHDEKWINIVAFSQHWGLHQLKKATVLAESYNISSFFIVIYELYWPQPGRCHSLSFLLIYFLTFYLSRFSFYSKGHVYYLISYFLCCIANRCNSSGKWDTSGKGFISSMLSFWRHSPQKSYYGWR